MLYFKVENPQKYFEPRIILGVNSKINPHNCCDDVGYISDPDGHITAFSN